MGLLRKSVDPDIAHQGETTLEDKRNTLPKSVLRFYASHARMGRQRKFKLGSSHPKQLHFFLQPREKSRRRIAEPQPGSCSQ